MSISEMPLVSADAGFEEAAASRRADTARANQEFYERAQCVPGVLRVALYNRDAPMSEQSFLVVVPTLDSPETDRILALQDEILARHPRVRLKVRIKGVLERGLTPGQAHEVL
jgi:hypothetical protein